MMFDRYRHARLGLGGRRIDGSIRKNALQAQWSDNKTLLNCGDSIKKLWINLTLW